MTTTPIECAYLDPSARSVDASLPPDDGCHATATWAILTPGARPADATYACHQHLAELCEDGGTVRRVDGEAGR